MIVGQHYFYLDFGSIGLTYCAAAVGAAIVLTLVTKAWSSGVILTIAKVVFWVI
jgi:hypothetical protein